ncbi:hypothetical protein EMA8858_02904 [Emticicia aquatica]|jgi:hypothetical protein|uniref:DUF3078 domain-containing protein n=1 Tax=Emticicia aquatica TaxID=1681835 RepID=A0ABM9AS68_9BACT|nr:DUF3078 domain-containing protein [Emticicia aquatica]CAH0996769.1 hypothetical protein EMA8858_02904 [Emticicia aquatica]
MKKVFLTICYFSFTINLFAQELPKNREDSLRIGWWDPRSTQFGINFSQSGFNDAWSGAQGSVGSIGIGFIFNNKAIYHKNKGVFSSDIQFQYGTQKNNGQDARKSIDRIFMDVKYGSKLSPTINWFAGANFLSQFAPGFAYDASGVKGNKISSLFAPGFLSEGVGLEWKPLKFFVLQLGGATLRQTFMTNDIVFANTQQEGTEDGQKIFRSYGVEKGKKVLNEMGFQVIAAFDKDIAKNLNLKWRYQGFVAYAPKTKPVDHNISLVTTAKVNKYLNVNFTVLGVYDADIVKKFQLSEGLAVGFLFTL